MVVGALVALGASGWFVAAIPPFGVESSAVTLAAGAVVLLAASTMEGRRRAGLFVVDAPTQLGRGMRRVDATDLSLRVPGIIAWSAGALLALGVELWELFHSPRSLYPTLSSMANEVVGYGHHIGRAVAFVCWGACGLLLASRPGWRK